jgi:flagellar basal-body rod protein FlgG
MLEGLYSAASGMEAQQTQFDAISNDLSNLDTPGYQSQIVGFRDLLYSNGGYAGNVPTGAGSSSQIVGRSQVQGPIQQTGRPLDVAIGGDGYLEVRRPDGTIGLSRNGALEMNAQGQLTNQEGMLLQPPVTIPRGVQPSQVSIAANGNVTAGGRQLGKIQLVTVPSPDNLTPVGDSMFTANAASGAIVPATGATLQQGALEGSNVDMAQAMSQLVLAQRTYSMDSSAVQDQDQMLQIANEIKP